MQHKPHMMVCYLCGQQFGSSSLTIHQPQCYQKQLTWWKQNDPSTRGPKPKDPAIAGHKSQDKMGSQDIQKFNDEQYQDFSQNLSPCEHCGRKFLPDRLVVHLRSCRPSGSGPPVGKSPPSNPQKNPGAKPQMLICYLCGQQYGTKSLAIHQPQCFSKKLVQWQDGDPQTRGPKPRDPKNSEGPPEGASREEWNNQQFDAHNQQLSKCPHCARTFLPDRLQVHLRSCGGGGGGGGGSGSDKATPPRQGKPQTVRPQMLVCYLCGQQFGSTSLSIHQPQCYTKQLLWWERADPTTRGPKPKDPETLPPGSQPTPGGNAQDFNDQQFKHFQENLSPCPNCGRTFLADRLAVHLRSCNPDASGRGSKPVTSPPGGYQKQSPQSSCPSSENGQQSTRSPLVNRLPSQKGVGRPCPECKILEHDPEAKFCQECGSTLNAPEPEPSKMLVCQSCNETWESGKFCQSCGGSLAEPAPEPPSANMCCTQCGVVITSKFCQECGTPNRSPLVNRLSSPQVVPPIPPPAYEEAIQQPSASHSPTGSESGPERKWTAEAPTDLPEVPEFNEDESQELVPCSNCGRSFLPDRLEKHIKACATQKNRRVFKQKLAGDEAATLKQTTSAPKKDKKDWKAASKSFRDAMRSARETDTAIKEGKALPPPTYTREEDDDRVQCPHCSRKFAEDVAARHIPKCATTVNRPNAPKVAKQTNGIRGTPIASDVSPKNRRPSALLSTITSNSTLGSPLPDDVARMGVSPEKWESIQRKKELEWGEAFGEQPKDLQACPNCNRNFVPKSLAIHLRSCGGRHGTSKKLNR